jgi:hypothetical protein
MRSLVAALTLFSLTARAEAPATVALVKGKVMVHRATGDVEATSAMTLGEDDEVQVPAGGLAVLRLANGYPVRIDEDLSLSVRDIDLRSAKAIDPLTRLDTVLTPSEKQELGTSLAGVQARLKGNSGDSVSADGMAINPSPPPPPGGGAGAAHAGFARARISAASDDAKSSPSAAPSASVAGPATPSPAQPDRKESEAKKTEITIGASGGGPTDTANEVSESKSDSKAKAKEEVSTTRQAVQPQAPSKPKTPPKAPVERFKRGSPVGKAMASPALKQCLDAALPPDLDRTKMEIGLRVVNGKVTQVAFSHGLPVPDACRVQLVGKALPRSDSKLVAWVWVALP